MAKIKPPAAAVSLDAEPIAARIDAQQQAALIKSGHDKIKAGKTATTRELAAIKRLDEQTAQKYGRQYIAAMPKQDYCNLVGVQAGALLKLQATIGFPYGEKNRPLDLRAVLKWTHAIIKQHGELLAGEGDPVLGVANGRLRESYVAERTEQVRLDNERRRLENATAAERFVPIEPLRQFHNKMADRIRRTREKFAKRFDADDREFCERQFDDMIDAIEKLADEQFTDDSDPET